MWRSAQHSTDKQMRAGLPRKTDTTHAWTSGNKRPTIEFHYTHRTWATRKIVKRRPKDHSGLRHAKWQTSALPKARPESSYQSKSSAEGGSQTLRQACYQEIPGSAMCVQNLDDSRGLAIRITYRISLRSSSLWEPRHPLLKVVMSLGFRGHPH